MPGEKSMWDEGVQLSIFHGANLAVVFVAQAIDPKASWCLEGNCLALTGSFHRYEAVNIE